MGTELRRVTSYITSDNATFTDVATAKAWQRKIDFIGWAGGDLPRALTAEAVWNWAQKNAEKIRDALPSEKE